MHEHHYAYRDDGAMFEVDADYVVIGSGAGGATAAVSLARGGASVVIVEAGPWRDPDDYPESMYGALRDMMDNWGTLLTRGRAFWPIVQARLVGGTTVINSSIVVRTPGDIFKQWQDEHGVGGDPMAEAVWRYQDEIENELQVEPVPPQSAGRHNELAAAAATALGMEGHVIDRNVKDCLGKGQCLQGCKAHKKQSTNLNYVPETLERGGRVLSCAPVDRIVLEGNRAIGVRGRFVHPLTRRKGCPFFVRANKAVVVAASCTHGPALLMKSGVKGPAMGKYFRAHPGTGVFGSYDDPVNMNQGATQGWASIQHRIEPGFKIETLSLPPELVASRLSGGGVKLMERLEEFAHITLWVAAVRAETVGSVAPGMFGPVVKYNQSVDDMKRLRAGLHTVAKMHFAVGARHVITGIFGMPYSIGPDQVDLLLDAPLDPRNYIGILSHLFGGAVMGADPKTSVCDEKGRVHGYEGLVIGDASQIPTNLGVNPQHTIMALARLRADQLLGA